MGSMKGWSQEKIDAENERVKANREARNKRIAERAARSAAFQSKVKTDWKVPDGMEQTRNRLFGIIMQEAGPRDRTLDGYTILSQRHVASAMHNYAKHYGLTWQELIDGKGRHGGPGYLDSLPYLQNGTAKGNPYSWADDKIDYDAVAIDDPMTKHAENAMRLASLMVNGKLNPMTDAKHFKNLGPNETWDGMVPVKMDTTGVNIPTNRVLKLYNDPREVKQASKGGNAPGESESSGVPSGHNAALDGYSGPRIIINPTTFDNSKDALCVCFNEAIRVFMEANSYEPQSEPTEKQRQFFADTPYADDELQLRRTILARICVFDTSVKDPTDDQLSESAQVLRSIIDSGFAKTDDEITKCERLARAIEAAVGAEPAEPREEPLRQAPLQPSEETQAAIGAGETEEDKDLFGQNGTVETTDQDAKDFAANAAPDNFGQNGTVETTDQDAKDFAGAAAPQQEAAQQLQQETLAPGLSRSGSRNNVLEFNGRRISQREFDRIQAKFQEGGPQQPTGIGGRTLTAGEAAWQAKRQASTEAWTQRTGQNASAVAGLPEEQPVQVAANDEGPLKPNNLRQTTQVDSGRRDRLGRRLDEYGRVIA